MNWEKEMIKDFLDMTNNGVINVPRIDLYSQRSKYDGEVLLINGIEDSVFSTEAAKIISKAYPKSLLAFIS